MATLETSPSGQNAGDLTLNAQRLTLTDGAAFVVAVPKENSDIIANAFAGRGGNINITAQGIFGLQLNNTKQPIPVSEITASSQLGIDGTITINSPDVDPSRGLTELPSNFTDSSNQIAAGCPADKGNRFSVTGRGGIRIIPVNICADAPFGKIRAIYPKPNSYPNPPPRHNQVKVTYKR